MEKDFDGWNRIKKQTDTQTRIPFFYEREVWWCTIGINVGSEQNGGEGFLRPVVVLKKFNGHMFWGVPLTGKRKTGKFYIPITTAGKHSSSAILSQLRLYDSRRLFKKMGTLSKEKYTTLIHGIVRLCEESAAAMK